MRLAAAIASPPTEISSSKGRIPDSVHNLEDLAAFFSRPPALSQCFVVGALDRAFRRRESQHDLAISRNEGRMALPFLHRAFVFAKGLLSHRNDSRNAFVIDRDLQIHGHGAIDPFAAARVLDIIIVLEAGGITVVRCLLAQANVTPDRRASRRPSRIISFNVAPNRIVRFAAFFEYVDGRRVKRHREIDVVCLVTGDEVVDEFVDPDLPGTIGSRDRRFFVRFGRAW